MTGMSNIAVMINFALLCLAILLPGSAFAADADTLYQQHCAVCHNAQRLGGMGPALLPGNLKRLRKKAAGDVIGPPWLAHVASEEAIVCVEKLAGHTPIPIDYEAIPGCTYCLPQVASLGKTEPAN